MILRAPFKFMPFHEAGVKAAWRFKICVNAGALGPNFAPYPSQM